MSTIKWREETELFHSYLRRNGLKRTHQKDLILETFLNTEGHLSIEDVHALAKKRDKKVGVVTVFRTLKSLKACGIAREIALGDGLTRYEHNYHHPNHHHIVCSNCHRTIEFACPELDRIQSEIIRKYRFQPGYHWFQAYGTCEDCQESRPVAESEKYDTERIFARDAAKMALWMEDRCLQFYRDCAKRNQDYDGRVVLEQVSGEEEKHIENLNKVLEEIIQPSRNLELAPVFLHFDAQELEKLIPDLSKYGRQEELALDAKSSLELALELNQNKAEFFRSYADRFTDTHGKQILLQFAALESDYCELLQQRIKQLFAT